MGIEVIKPSQAEMDKCIARFSNLVPCNSGLPDMDLLPDCSRTFYNVLGFQPPLGADQYSPFGNMAPALVTHIRAGFGMAYIGAKPGCGVLMHTHDSVETFIVMHGTWLLEWELDSGTQGVILEPLDFVACPIGVNRRFECLETGAGREEGLMLGVIGGEMPAVEISPNGIQRLIAAGAVLGTGAGASMAIAG